MNLDDIKEDYLWQFLNYKIEDFELENIMVTLDA